jgi:uncharacterized protein (TIGR03067 family)
MSLVLLLVLLDAPKPEIIKEPPKELSQSDPGLRGTWLVVAALKEGDRLSPQKIQTLSVVITGSSITVQDAVSTEMGTHTLDRSVQPRTIDILSEKAPREGTVRGVYDLDGDDLKIAWTKAGHPRPRSADMNDCKPTDLPVTTFLVLKRKK